MPPKSPVFVVVAREWSPHDSSHSWPLLTSNSFHCFASSSLNSCYLWPSERQLVWLGPQLEFHYFQNLSDEESLDSLDRRPPSLHEYADESPRASKTMTRCFNLWYPDRRRRWKLIFFWPSAMKSSSYLSEQFRKPLGSISCYLCAIYSFVLAPET